MALGESEIPSEPATGAAAKVETEAETWNSWAV